jgi:hypothetical protein
MMEKTLSKTDFVSYKDCAKNVWVKWHKPDIYKSFPVSDFEKSLGEMGNEVEERARSMFPNGFLVEKRSAGAQELTKKLVDEKTPVIFQAVFQTDNFLAATDVLEWNPKTNLYDLYEIKMSSTEEADIDGTKKVDRKKETQFEYDLAFQTNVAEASGLKLGKKYLIRLNKDYIRTGELDFTRGALFIIEDKSEIIDGIRDGVSIEMKEAYDYLSNKNEPVGPCSCFYKGRSSHCTTFSYSNRGMNIPEYSVHDLNRIGSSKKYLTELLDSGILDISDVPIDERLKTKKLNQVMVHKSGKPMIDVESLKEELDQLVFPLYFLDYETSPKAIPPYSRYKPYQHIVFQYSLHVLRSPEAEPEHYECLILDGDPSERIAKSLRENIGDKGTVISWFAPFENSRNRELGKMLPEYKTFMDNVVARTYDLMKIVEDQHYVHPDFHGRSSIKKVLPAIFPNDPELDYKKLGVKNGTDAIESYRKIVDGELVGVDAKQKKQEMLEYCKLDTYAMYKLWKFFYELVN